ncbi:MAG: class I SAM-dependent methyltransferase [Acidobacteria bacterium]|nr:MAG: class I SAM-dependent methyltransferase [Acidobacteriota bacterium]
MSPHSHKQDERHGARQPERFNPERAARLDDPARFEYLPSQEVAKLLDVPAQGKLLDFGTGTGTYAIELASLRPDVEVIAFDEQAEMLDLLRAKLAARKLDNLKPALPEDIASCKGKIDRVLALNVLHELGDEALRNLKSLLKPGGAALFIDWNPDVERPAGPPAAHLYSPAEGRRRLQQMGFVIQGEKLLPYHYSIFAD